METDKTTLLPLYPTLREWAESGEAYHYKCRNLKHLVIELLDRYVALQASVQSFDAPTTYAPATDNEVKVALAEYHDAEEYNSDEVNMKAAIDAVLYLRGSTEQASGDAMWREAGEHMDRILNLSWHDIFELLPPEATTIAERERVAKAIVERFR